MASTQFRETKGAFSKCLGDTHLLSFEGKKPLVNLSCHHAKLGQDLIDSGASMNEYEKQPDQRQLL